MPWQSWEWPGLIFPVFAFVVLLALGIGVGHVLLDLWRERRERKKRGRK
jgi:hypothetical protein